MLQCLAFPPLLRRRRLQLRSPVTPEMSNTRVEEAFSICECNGQYAKGSHATGDATSVSLDVRCPHGYRALGIFHTHPGGHPILSQADIREARRLGVHHMCVGVPQTGELKCHVV